MTPTGQLPTAYSYARFSSEGQQDGNSIDRQTKRAREWCEREGFDLSTVTFHDLGVSAYKGANVDVGALGAFLQAVEEGSVERGSTLLVENLDRLSRQHFEEGYLLIKRITQAGINVVTLSDGKTYRAGEPLELVDMITMVVGFERANQESRFKSERVGAAWKSNAERVRDGKRKRTTKVPAWIKFKGDSLDEAELVLIPEKAEVIREVFSRYADGEPTSAIARDLREREVPTLSGRGSWTGPLLYMLVREVTPYGTLLIGEGTKKDRRIVGEVPEYYPRAVDEDVQRRVLLRIQRGHTGPGGSRKGPREGDTRGRLVGVLRSADGNKAKAKRNNRSISYVDRVTNRYVGTVGMIDQVLIDGWNEVVGALDVTTSPEVEALEVAEVIPTVELLEDLERRREEKPSPALDRMILGAEADLEEARTRVEEARKRARIGGAVPDEIALMPIPEVNAWVRRIVETASVRREGRGKGAKVRLTVRLKNGVMLALGDLTVGLEKVPGGGAGEPTE